MFYRFTKEWRVADMPGAGPIQVLVVDDEEPIRTALSKFLTQQHYEVHAAGSGDEALQQLRRHPRPPRNMLAKERRRLPFRRR